METRCPFDKLLFQTDLLLLEHLTKCLRGRDKPVFFCPYSFGHAFFAHEEAIAHSKVCPSSSEGPTGDSDGIACVQAECNQSSLRKIINRIRQTETTLSAKFPKEAKEEGLGLFARWGLTDPQQTVPNLKLEVPRPLPNHATALDGFSDNMAVIFSTFPVAVAPQPVKKESPEFSVEPKFNKKELQIVTILVKFAEADRPVAHTLNVDRKSALMDRLSRAVWVTLSKRRIGLVLEDAGPETISTEEIVSSNLIYPLKADVLVTFFDDQWYILNQKGPEDCQFFGNSLKRSETGLFRLLRSKTSLAMELWSKLSWFLGPSDSYGYQDSFRSAVELRQKVLDTNAFASSLIAQRPTNTDSLKEQIPTAEERVAGLFRKKEELQRKLEEEARAVRQIEQAGSGRQEAVLMEIVREQELKCQQEIDRVAVQHRESKEASEEGTKRAEVEAAELRALQAALTKKERLLDRLDQEIIKLQDEHHKLEVQAHDFLRAKLQAGQKTRLSPDGTMTGAHRLQDFTDACVSCLDSLADVMYGPCGHVNYQCWNCLDSEGSTRCEICSTVIEARIRIKYT